MGVYLEHGIFGVKQIQKLEIQGRDKEENTQLSGCNGEQMQSLSHHEASSWLGLRHSPKSLAWARVVGVSQVLHVLGGQMKV